MNSPDKTMDQLVRLESLAEIVEKCRGIDDVTPNGRDPNDLGPLYPPVYMNNTTNICYNEVGVINWTKKKLPGPVPDPMAPDGKWIIPTELLARIDSFPVQLIEELLKEPTDSDRRWRAMELFRKKIPYAVSYHEESDNSCMFLMCSQGMRLQAEQWFRQTLGYRKVFNMFAIHMLNSLGLVQEAKNLFGGTYQFATSYNSGVIRALYLLWGEEQARLMMEFTEPFHQGGEYMDIERIHRILNM
jgi:hypothetical protein